MVGSYKENHQYALGVANEFLEEAYNYKKEIDKKIDSSKGKVKISRVIGASRDYGRFDKDGTFTPLNDSKIPGANSKEFEGGHYDIAQDSIGKCGPGKEPGKFVN